MSFAHRPRPSSTVSFSMKPKRTQSEKKQPWDSTVNDLNAYKASPEELDRRKTVHRSDNLSLVQDEKMRQKLSKAQLKNSRRGNDHGQIALLREILNDSGQLQESLADSDKLLASVRNILGADPKRFAGIPCLTRAPNAQPNDRSLPDGPSDQSRLDLLSDVVMDRNALNQSDSSQSSVESNEPVSSVNYRPVLDLVRFQRLLHDAEEEIRGTSRTVESARNKDIKSNKGAGDGATNREGLKIGDQRRVEDKMNAVDTTPVKDTPVAMNDTQKVRRMQARTDQSTGSGATTSVLSVTPTIEDLNRVLNEVQNNLSEYEKHTDKRVERTTATSFSGYTMALLDTVARMSIYFKECEVRLRTEAVVREQLMDEVVKLTGLVDALTTDIMATQEEYARLGNEFVKHRRETDQQLLSFAHSLSMHGIDVRILRPQQSVLQSVHPGMNSDDTALNGTISSQAGARVARLNGSIQQNTSVVQPVLNGVQAVPLALPVQTDSPAVPGGRQSKAPISRDLIGVRNQLVFDDVPVDRALNANHQEYVECEQYQPNQQQRALQGKTTLQEKHFMHPQLSGQRQVLGQQQQQQTLDQQKMLDQQQQMSGWQQMLGQQQQMSGQQQMLGQQQPYESLDALQQRQQPYPQQLGQQQQQQQQALPRQQAVEDRLRQHVQPMIIQQQMLHEQRMLYEQLQQEEERQQLASEQQQRHRASEQQQQQSQQQRQPTSEQQQRQLASEQQQRQLVSEQQQRQFDDDRRTATRSATDIRSAPESAADPGHAAVRQQLDEINRQTAVAQRKLDDLMPPRSLAEAATRQSKNVASPSISPITCESESNLAQAFWQLSNGGAISAQSGAPVIRGGPTRQIRVTLPQATADADAVDNMNLYFYNQQQQQRRVGDGQSTMPERVQNNVQSKMRESVNTGFFALSSHVSS